MLAPTLYYLLLSTVFKKLSQANYNLNICLSDTIPAGAMEPELKLLITALAPQNNCDSSGSGSATLPDKYCKPMLT